MGEGRIGDWAMNMLLAGILLVALSVVVPFVAGWFCTPYLDAFRFAFYLVLILLILTVGFVVLGHQYEGYDPTVRVP
ncbi:MAG: hypothetical protein OJF50_002575 [Nitrospira sp.]|jgi:uncharacterized RDD family membrane protein YckC|nr:hypothetical protein [Nitrospira sp.]